MGDKISKNILTEDDLNLLQSLSGKPREEILFWYDHFMQECPTGKMNKGLNYYWLFNQTILRFYYFLTCFYFLR